jgi:outer membrane autotransporter protein
VANDFKNVVLPEPNLFVTFHKNLFPTAVQIETEVKPFDSQACNRMQHAVASTLDRIGASGHASDDLMAHMRQLQEMSAPQYHSALSALTPGSYSRNTISTSQQYTKSLQHRMQNVRGATGRNLQKSQILPEDTGMHNDLFYNFDRFSPVQGKNGLWFDSFEQQRLSGFDDYSMNGMTFGFDRSFSDPLLLGVSGGYAKSSAGLDGGAGSGDIGNYYGSLYGSYSLKDLSFDGVFSYGKSRYDTDRLISTGGAPVQADSNHDGDLFSGYLRAGYAFRLNDWILEPFASAQYLHLKEKGYTESGAGGLGLKVDGTTTRSFVSELGTRFTRVFSFENGKIVPEVSAAWLHDFNVSDQAMSSSFAGAPDSSFTVAGPKSANNGATVGAGITFMQGDAFSMSLNYSGEYRDDISHRILGEIRINF